jgi:hypothetical protein
LKNPTPPQVAVYWALVIANPYPSDLKLFLKNYGGRGSPPGNFIKDNKKNKVTEYTGY